MTTVETAEPASRQDRLVFALRQALILAVALFVAGLVTERLRPEEASDRGIVSTPFLWAIVLWFVVLVVNAVAFDRSQMHILERTPLYLASGIGFLVLLLGLVSFDPGPLGRRLVYVAANSLGAVLFWWAALGLLWLLSQRVSD